MEIILYLLLTFSFSSQDGTSEKLLQDQNLTHQTTESDTGAGADHPDLKPKWP
jgi:hypothetical protein